MVGAPDPGPRLEPAPGGAPGWRRGGTSRGSRGVRPDRTLGANVPDNEPTTSRPPTPNMNAESSLSTDPRPRALPAAVVGRAIQESAVPRLARGFVPVAVAFVAGGAGAAAGAFRGPSAWVLVLGAPVTAAAMLAYALRVVQRAFGRPHRPWMTMASAAAVLPPAYGLWACVRWPGGAEARRCCPGSS